MGRKADIQHNKLMQLENAMLMYGVYNVETLEKFITTVHNIHNTTSSHKVLFAGQHNLSMFSYLIFPLTGLFLLERQAFNRFSCLHQVLKKMFS